MEPPTNTHFPGPFGSARPQFDVDSTDRSVNYGHST